MTTATDPVVWAIGYTREPAVQMSTIEGTISQRSLYYQSNFSDDASLVSSFLSDYSSASQRATTLDTKLASAAADIGDGVQYADLVALVPRQVYGATELTVGPGSDGKLNTSDVVRFDIRSPMQSLSKFELQMMFMRDNGGQETG